MFPLDPDRLRFGCVSARERLVDSLSACRSGAVIAALASTSYEPANVHAGPPGGQLIRLSDTRPELRAIRWGSQQRLSYRAPDGLGLDGLLIVPPGRGTRADGPFPLITLVHGGPDYRHADEFMLAPHPTGQWLATAGYAVFLANPRGGVGHGRDFAATVARSVGGSEWSDITSGIDLLIAEGVADPGRLGIGGARLAGSWPPGDRADRPVQGRGDGRRDRDWGTLVATSEGPTLDAALSGSCGWERPGPHPHDLVSPISFASRIRTPVLIVNGQDDADVPVSRRSSFPCAQLDRAEPELVIYPREGHGLVERNHQLDLLRRTRAWFDRWLHAEASDGRGSPA